MRRNVITIAILLLLSGGAAATSNLVYHEMDWLRMAEKIPVSSDESTGRPAGMIGLDALVEHVRNGTAHIIDARELEDFEVGHIQGAFLLPANAIYENIESVIEIVPPDDLVIIYCDGKGCDASQNVAYALRHDYDFTNVLIHERGWEEVERSAVTLGDIIAEGDE